MIVKPAKSQEGKGIKLLNSVESILGHIQNYNRTNKPDDFIIQKYIDNPFLYQNKKFHLRMYALIFEKQVYFYQNGFIIHSLFDYDTNNSENLAIHITNQSI